MRGRPKKNIISPPQDKMVKDSLQKSDTKIQKEVNIPFVYCGKYYKSGDTIDLTDNEYNRMVGNNYFKEEVKTK